MRTWIEIDKNALHHNVEQFLRILKPGTRFMAVVKSNAYGHGLVQVAKELSKIKLQKSEMWFGVDSVIEAFRLRDEGIKHHILVLGPTLPSRMPEAKNKNITLTISNFEGFKSLNRVKNPPAFHLKIDTGMHRQGFLISDLPRLVNVLKSSRLKPNGIYTHFAAAKDIAYPTYTFSQLKKFNYALDKLDSKKGGWIRHAAASGGALLFPESHLDMVRIGMGLYGYWPSSEARLHLEEKIKLNPVLTWKTVVSEIKEIPKNSYVGYDLSERVNRDTKIAVLPIGYWHGYDRGLSNTGEVIIRKRRAKLLGRVSMDMVVADVTRVFGVGVGDEVTLIGKEGKTEVWADELSLKIGTTPYEFLTRINPLIRRVII